MGCREELPRFQKLYERFKSKGFAILSVNVEDMPAVVKKLWKAQSLSFPVVLDAKANGLGFYGISDRYKVVGTPTNYLLDAKGKIVLHANYLTENMIVDALAELGVK